MTWNDPHPTSKSQTRKPFPPRPDRNYHEANIIPIGPTPTPSGCKRNISDSTRAQMIYAFVYTLGMFLYVHFLPQVTII